MFIAIRKHNPIQHEKNKARQCVYDGEHVARMAVNHRPDYDKAERHQRGRKRHQPVDPVDGGKNGKQKECIKCGRDIAEPARNGRAVEKRVLLHGGFLGSLQRFRLVKDRCVKCSIRHVYFPPEFISDSIVPVVSGVVLYLRNKQIIILFHNSGKIVSRMPQEPLCPQLQPRLGSIAVNRVVMVFYRVGDARVVQFREPLIRQDRADDIRFLLGDLVMVCLHIARGLLKADGKRVSEASPGNVPDAVDHGRDDQCDSQRGRNHRGQPHAFLPDDGIAEGEDSRAKNHEKTVPPDENHVDDCVDEKKNLSGRVQKGFLVEEAFQQAEREEEDECGVQAVFDDDAQIPDDVRAQEITEKDNGHNGPFRSHPAAQQPERVPENQDVNRVVEQGKNKQADLTVPGFFKGVDKRTEQDGVIRRMKSRDHLVAVFGQHLPGIPAHGTGILDDEVRKPGKREHAAVALEYFLLDTIGLCSGVEQFPDETVLYESPLQEKKQEVKDGGVNYHAEEKQRQITHAVQGSRLILEIENHAP